MCRTSSQAHFRGANGEGGQQALAPSWFEACSIWVPGRNTRIKTKRRRRRLEIWYVSGATNGNFGRRRKSTAWASCLPNLPTQQWRWRGNDNTNTRGHSVGSQYIVQEQRPLQNSKKMVKEQALVNRCQPGVRSPGCRWLISAKPGL